MKLRVLLISLLLLAPLAPSISATPPKAGEICRKAGVAKNYNGKKYTCVKSGKKLVWNKGVIMKSPAPELTPIPVPTTSPTTSQSPSPAPTNIVNPNPIPTASPSPVPSLTPTPARSAKKEVEPITTFSELRNRFLDFHYLAWKRSNDQILKSPENTSLIIELVGPNSKKCPGKSIEAIRTTQRLFAASKLPSTLRIIYADKGDEEWLYQETKKYLRPFELTMQENVQVNPHSVNSETKEGVEWIQDSCTETRPNFLDGSATAHGYTHIIQKMQFTSNQSQWGTWGKAPRWLLEGGATFADQIVMYRSDEERWLDFIPKNTPFDLRRYDLKSFEEYFNSDGWQVTEKFPNQRAYDLGFIVCEILVAMKGPSVLIDLYFDLSQTQNFDLSFKNTFGVTWTEAKPDVAYAIYKYIKYWNS